MEKISIKNIWIWFKDQMTHPRTFFDKISWGVFSVYAHIRRSDHKPKQSYPTKEKALSVATEMHARNRAYYTIYKCVYCDGWHVAKVAESKDPEIPSAMPEADTGRLSKSLDVEKILATRIPDIHAVYGGVRGRTLASSKLADVWPIVKEAGIRTVIDLREDGIHSKLGSICEKYGVRYYFYKVDKKAELIGSMIEQFEEFCSVIDEGNFYIACAEGLHRTDIALCTYWVFYAADKGMSPPAVWGYREEKGRTTEKIRRMLNAFYKALTEKYGKAPIPLDTFLERKQIIEMLSKK